MAYCPNCGTEIEEGKKFCRQCGMPVHLTDEEANTRRLPPNTQPTPTTQNPTTPVAPGPTAPSNHPIYAPPVGYYPPVPAGYHPPMDAGRSHISLGEWLSQGWQVYKQNWLLMSLATMLTGFLGSVTCGILAGPMLMGLYRMTFKSMRGEQPEMNDLFNWEGRFLQAFLAFLISAAIYGGITGAGNNSPLFAIFGFLITPMLTFMLAFTLPLILERRMDIATAINEVGHLILSRDAIMWWVVGLVFATIIPLGMLGCGIGLFVTTPWMISSAAVAYRDIYGLDDPNRTLH